MKTESNAFRSPEPTEPAPVPEAHPKEAVVEDLREALQAMMGSRAMVEAGLNDALADSIARNSMHFDRLPEQTRRQIAQQFGEQAMALSSLQSASRHSEVASRTLIRWLKGVNLLLAMAGKGLA